MENAYAQALWRVIEKGTNPSDAVRTLYLRLKSEGRQAFMPRVGKAFERIAARASDRDTVVLTVADATYAAHAHKEAAAAGLDVKHAKTRVDHTLIGGWRFESAEDLVDASYKKHLLAIYRGATRS